MTYLGYKLSVGREQTTNTSISEMTAHDSVQEVQGAINGSRLLPNRLEIAVRSPESRLAIAHGATSE